MSINSEKANAIDAYIKSRPNCKKGKQKVVIQGKVQMLDSYMIPTSLLQYNRENRRFNLEIHEEEQKLGRKLDPTDANDVVTIKGLLLADESEAKKLKDDLRKVREQTDVAAISFDGIVVNGNRRMATLEELDDEEPTGVWKDLWVVRLPREISESDLWKIEAGLQLSKQKVAEYGPVNNLLMIREGEKAGLTHAEIAAAMYGWTEDQIAVDLERLGLMDNFLQFAGQPGNYGLIKKFGLAEYFHDIQKTILKASRSKGESKREIQRRLELGFLLLRASIWGSDSNFTHWDMRKVGAILGDFEANAALTEGINKGTDLRKISSKQILDKYSNAKDVLEYKKDRDKPKTLLEKALNALKGIDRKGEHYKADVDVKKKFKELVNLIEEMKSELGIN